MQWLTENPTIATMMDQDAINYTLYRRKVFFDKKFNLNPIHDPPAKTLAEIPERVLHFAGAIKPWHSWYDFELIKIFDFYKKVASVEEMIGITKPTKFGQFVSIANQSFSRNDFKESSEQYHAAIVALSKIRQITDQIIELTNQAIASHNRGDYYNAANVFRGLLDSFGVSPNITDVYQLPEIR
jgi:lipopolysaccharide biosynthesis glycosyltransferase